MQLSQLYWTYIDTLSGSQNWRKKITSDSEFFTNMLYMINLVCRSSIKIRDLISNCAIVDIEGSGRHRRDGSP
jgi:hypothetical protein